MGLRVFAKRSGIIAVIHSLFSLLVGCASGDRTEIGSVANSIVSVCPSETLQAQRSYSPTRATDGVVQFAVAREVQVPASLPVIAGNAGNHWAELLFVRSSGSTLRCRYRGGSPQSNPQTPDQIALGQQYVFSSCLPTSEGITAGSWISTSEVRLSVQSGSHQHGTTVVRVALDSRGNCATDGGAADVVDAADVADTSTAPDVVDVVDAEDVQDASTPPDAVSDSAADSPLDEAADASDAGEDSANVQDSAISDVGEDAMDASTDAGEDTFDAGTDAGTDTAFDADTGTDTGTDAGVDAGDATIDTGLVVPPLDRTIATTVYEATAFLYSGTNPVQTGVSAGTIDRVRVVALHGRVLDRAGNPLENVGVSIVGHAEFGQTRTRANGEWDLVVNGGSTLVVRFETPGRLTVDRSVESTWQSWRSVPDVVMITLDSNVYPIAFPHATDVQVVRGSPITDSDGSRTATLMLLPGTTAMLQTPTGNVPVSELHMRATEYTVGSTGPQAMPASLPPASAYTYAVELGADEELAAGATEILLSQPAVFYLDNFLDYYVGSRIPLGRYDDTRTNWVSFNDGFVLKIVAISGGLAELDFDGDDIADDPSTRGITDAERAQLASLYAPGKELWRFLLPQLSSWDCNGPFALPFDAIPPPWQKPPLDNNVQCISCGKTVAHSIVEVLPRTLSEHVGVAGTPHTLVYNSRRARAQFSRRTEFQITESSVPASLLRVELDLEVAGRKFNFQFPPVPNQRHVFVWDGLDRWGRRPQGPQQLLGTLTYVYPYTYSTVAPIVTRSFGLPGTGVAAVRSRINPRENRYQRTFDEEISGWEDAPVGLGGWSIASHHRYDHGRRTIFFGDGSSQNSEMLGAVVSRIPGTTLPTSDPGHFVAFGPDGLLYEANAGMVHRFNADRTITRLAGQELQGYSGDGGPATLALFEYLSGIAVGPDGSIYLADGNNQRIRKITPDGIVRTIAGTGVQGFSGDEGPATSAQVHFPASLVLSPSGTLYFVDSGNCRIRAITPEGTMHTVLGAGSPGSSNCDNDTLTTTLRDASTLRISPAYSFNGNALALGPDGSLYLGTTAFQILRLRTDGQVEWVAGTGLQGGDGDDGPATRARLYFAGSLAVDGNGQVAIADYLPGDGFFVRRIEPDGTIHRIVGAPFTTAPNSAESGLALQVNMLQIHGLAYRPDGALVLASNNFSHWIVQSMLPGTAEQYTVPSGDGSLLYVFDREGRHLRTQHALTLGVLESFGYTSSGQLSVIADGDGNETRIEHDLSGRPSAIVGPNGHRTVLTLNASGQLASVQDPLGNTYRMGYQEAEGLLTSFQNPRGVASGVAHAGEWLFTYDSEGRLLSDQDAAGDVLSLTRSDIPNGIRVITQTSSGRSVRYDSEITLSGNVRRTQAIPGLEVVERRSLFGSSQVETPDGMVSSQTVRAHPRLGMAAAFGAEQTARFPSGLTSSVTSRVVPELSDPNNPLSLVRQTTYVNNNGEESSSSFEASTRQVQSSSPEGRVATVTVDALGRPTRAEVPGLEPVLTSYDARGRLSSVQMGARTTQQTYDAQGRVETITDPLMRVTRFTYDAADRVRSQTFPDGRVVGFDYDENGNVTSVTPPSRPSHTMTYSAVDLLASYDPPPLSSGPTRTRYVYNTDRQVSQVIRPDGSTITPQYDSFGRLQSVTSPEGVSSYTYSTATGHLQRVETPAGVRTEFAYDGSRVTDVVWSGGVAGAIHWEHDNQLRVTSQQVSGAPAVTFGYDRDSLLTRAGVLTIARNAGNGLVTETSAGSVTTAHSYNGFGEPTEEVTRFDGTEVYANAYVRDSIGRITERTERVNGVSTTFAYSYDAAGRLFEVRENGVLSAHYEYDGNGNRILRRTSAGDEVGAYDDQDRVQSYGGETFTHTANGEWLTRTSGTGQTTRYAYDSRGNLVRVELPDGHVIEYVVDGANRRVGRKLDGVLTHQWLWQGQLRPAAELDGAGNLVSVFVYGLHVNVPELILRGGRIYRVVTDQLGSVRMVVDTQSGSVVQRMRYDEWGRVLEDTNPGWQPFGFAGGLWETRTGLVRFGARDYEAGVGRWSFPDPERFSAGDSNLYQYSASNPINFIDPSGRWAWLLVAAAVELAETVAFYGSGIFVVSYATNSLTGIGVTTSVSLVAATLAAPSGSGSVGFHNGRLVFEFRNHPFGGSAQTGVLARTLGNVVCYSSDLSAADFPATRIHEFAHVDQHRVLGDAYVPAHLGLMLGSFARTGSYAKSNPLEWGPYSTPSVPWSTSCPPLLCPSP